MAGQRALSFMGFYVLQADEIGVKLTLGKFSGIVGPGPGFASPLLQRIIKTKSSLQTIDLPDQQIVLNGNIAITISGNLNFRVAEPEKALLKVDNYRYTVQQFALTTISDVLSTKTVEDVRNEKVKIAQEIEDIVAATADRWGLADVDIRLTDARLADNLMRAMMRETEAEKEARASQIRANADKAVAESFADAARLLASSPGAMTLRVLQALGDLSNEKTTIVLPIPVDMLSMAGPKIQAQPNVVSAVGKGAPHDTESLDLDQPADDAVESLARPAENTSVKIPFCKLTYQEDKTLAECPHCFTKYNVTEVMGDMRYDRLPDVPGLQVQCKRCKTVFTLPGSE